MDHDPLVIMALTIALALCIKLSYGPAGPEGLVWMLYPTAELVKAFTSSGSLFDPAEGYVAMGGAA